MGGSTPPALSHLLRIQRLQLLLPFVFLAAAGTSNKHVRAPRGDKLKSAYFLRGWWWLKIASDGRFLKWADSPKLEGSAIEFTEGPIGKNSSFFQCFNFMMCFNFITIKIKFNYILIVKSANLKLIHSLKNWQKNFLNAWKNRKSHLKASERNHRDPKQSHGKWKVNMLVGKIALHVGEVLSVYTVLCFITYTAVSEFFCQFLCHHIYLSLVSMQTRIFHQQQSIWTFLLKVLKKHSQYIW